MKHANKCPNIWEKLEIVEVMGLQIVVFWQKKVNHTIDYDFYWSNYDSARKYKEPLKYRSDNLRMNDMKNLFFRSLSKY